MTSRPAPALLICLIACGGSTTGSTSTSTGQGGSTAAGSGGDAGTGGTGGSAGGGGTGGAAGGQAGVSGSSGYSGGSAGGGAAPGGRWTRLDTCPDKHCPLMPSARTCAWTGSRWLAYDTFARQSQVFDPATGQVSEVAVSSPPSERGEPAWAWLGDRAWLWGGYLPTQLQSLGDGAVWDVSASAWTPIASAGAPAPRQWAHVIVTDEHVLLWGGTTFVDSSTPNFGEPLHDGHLWSRATGAWSPISTTGAPLHSSHSTAAWTGHEMIVWDTYTALQRYDLAQDTWHASSASGVPKMVGSAPTAVWTGARVLYWSAPTAPSPTTTAAAMYDPAADQWLPMASAGGLYGNSRYTSLWTGSQMVVINPDSSSLPASTISTYSLAADAWTPATTDGDPLLSSVQCSAWDGQRVLLWGTRYATDGSEPSPWSEIWAYEPPPP